MEKVVQQSKQRVLITLGFKGKSAPALLYLTARLQDRFDFVILTYDPRIVEDCERLGLEYVLIDLPSQAKTKWPKVPLLFGPLRAFERYQHERRLAALSEEIIDRTRADAVFVQDDRSDLMYHLCHHPGVNAVVYQTSMEEMDVAISNGYRLRRESKSDRRVRNLLEKFTRITGWPIVARYGSELYPLSGDLWSALGMMAGGVRINAQCTGGGAAAYSCVMGPHYAKVFAEIGVPEEKIVATGHPNHDRLVEMAANFSETEAAQLRAILEIPAHGEVVIFFLTNYGSKQPGYQTYDEEVKWVTDNLLGLSPDVFVVAKTHPKNNTEHYVRILSGPRVRIASFDSFTSGEDLNTQLLLLSRMAVTSGLSTISHSVIALDIPQLTYDFNNHPLMNLPAKIGWSVHATCREDFAEAANGLFFDEQLRRETIHRQRQVRGQYMMLDGKCCDRIGDVLSRQPRQRKSAT
jgi:hypothetical protein